MSGLARCAIYPRRSRPPPPVPHPPRRYRRPSSALPRCCSNCRRITPNAGGQKLRPWRSTSAAGRPSLCWLAMQPSQQGIIDMAFYELRQYKVLPGKMDEWVKIMEEEIIPFQVSKGMVICGSFRGESDDSAYVWLRRFESEAEREALYKAVYDTDYWKTKIAPRVPACLDRAAMVVTRILPTAKSTMR